MPWVVQTRYDGIAWYVSARIYAVGEMLERARHRETRIIEERRTFPPCTRTEARISSGSPMRFRGGKLRSSWLHDTKLVIRSARGRRADAYHVYASSPRLVAAHPKPGYRRRPPRVRSISPREGEARSELGIKERRVKRARKIDTAYARFCTKSLSPASWSSPGVSAGSQPSTVLDSENGGGSAKRDTAKTGRVSDRGVGGGTR
jgi:hypothetical protein